jgi:hypothetical protein
MFEGLNATTPSIYPAIEKHTYCLLCWQSRLGRIEGEHEMNAITICDAITGKMVIRFYYDGGIRVVEPHCHGTSTEGNEVLRAYQIGGYSNSGQHIGWKLIAIKRVYGIRPEGTTFAANRPGYEPNDRAMSSIHCAV